MSRHRKLINHLKKKNEYHEVDLEYRGAPIILDFKNNKVKDKISKAIFSLRWKLMPDEFKKGSWLFINGDALDIGDLWLKSKKKDTWYMPTMEFTSKKDIQT